jgi:hypothetical protein
MGLESKRSNEYPFLYVQRALAEALLREGLKSPPVQFDIALIRHETVEDVRALRAEIKSCDIFIPEFSVMGDNKQRGLQELSDGVITRVAYDRRYLSEHIWKFGTLMQKLRLLAGYTYKQTDPFYNALLDEIEGSGKPVGLIDTHVEAYGKTYITGATELKEFFREKVSFADVVKDRLERSRDIYTEYREREDAMITNLIPQLVSLIRTSLRLQSPPRTESIKIFMFLGSNHFPIVNRLQNSDAPVASRSAQNASTSHQAKGYVRGLREGMFSNEDASLWVLEDLFRLLFDSVPASAREKYLKTFCCGLDALVYDLADSFGVSALMLYNRMAEIFMSKNKQFIETQSVKLLDELIDEKRDVLLSRIPRDS